MHTYIHTRTHTYIHTYTQQYTHTHTHIIIIIRADARLPARTSAARTHARTQAPGARFWLAYSANRGMRVHAQAHMLVACVQVSSACALVSRMPRGLPCRSTLSLSMPVEIVHELCFFFAKAWGRAAGGWLSGGTPPGGNLCAALARALAQRMRRGRRAASTTRLAAQEPRGARGMSVRVPACGSSSFIPGTGECLQGHVGDVSPLSLARPPARSSPPPSCSRARCEGCTRHCLRREHHDTSPPPPSPQRLS